MKEKTKKISKGYRLSPGTHKLVARIKSSTKTDVDTVISTACKLLYREIKKNTLIKQC